MIIKGGLRAKKRWNQRGTQLAEFGPALLLFFIFIFFPLFDLITVMMGVATVMLCANVTARAASPAMTKSTAVTNAMTEGDKILKGPLGAFAKISPLSAEQGITIEVWQYPRNGGTPTQFSGGTIDTTNNYYIYKSRCKFDVSAMFNFQGNPFLGDVPLLGKPLKMDFASTCYVEHPEGLNS